MRFPGLLLVLAFAGCSLGCATPQPNLGQRIYADLACTVQIAASIGAVSADPAVQKASENGATATDVLNAIATVGVSQTPVDVLTACGPTIQYGVQDGQAIGAAVKAKVQESKGKK